MKRPLNSRFRAAVLDGTKITTIRDKPWPVGVPIMLYSWSGAAYRSPHDDVATVVVEETTPIRIGRSKDGSLMFFLAERGIHKGRHLWSCEGFYNEAEMDDWFREKLKPGQFADKALMRFRRFEGGTL